MMQEYENSDSLLLFNDFCIESGKNGGIKNLNLEIKSNCDVLLYSGEVDISKITGIFTFNIFNDIKFSGKLLHKGRDIIELVNKIKKFKVNGNRIGILTRLIDDIFPLPADPLELLDPDLTISEQILGFIPYRTRIEVLNGIIRREMIKLTEIKEIIKEFDSADDKKTYVLKKSMDFGILQIYRNIYDILDSASENREDLMVSSIIAEKSGVNLADIVVLRNYYRYRIEFDLLQGEINRNNIEEKDNSKLYKKLAAIKKETKRTFDFTGFKLTRHYSENILKNEILALVKNYMELMGISFNPDNLERVAGNSNISDIYGILTCISFLTDKKMMVIDLSGYSSEAMNIIEYIKRLKSVQNMACLYICTNKDMSENKNKIFDRVIFA
ncbi:hypothetical protein [Ferroplasma sp.]|uniref:hypothetical protein n=1 Tax=Ferroplasma sp. TaxID=2591003 RepID=UPI00307D375E